jgi:hypothetical protein
MPISNSFGALSSNTFSLCGLALLLAACASEPTIQRGEDAEVIDDRLYRVDNARFDFAYVDPEIDFGRYRQVRLLPLDLDHAEIVQPSRGGGVGRLAREEWELDDEDRRVLQDAYIEAMNGAIARSERFTVTDAAGPDVIAVEAILTRLAPSAPKDDMRSRPAGHSRVFTQGAGSISIAVALVASESGEVLALAKDTRDGETDGWGLNERVSNIAEVRRVFGLWAGFVAGGLDRIASQRSDGTEAGSDARATQG